MDAFGVVSFVSRQRKGKKVWLFTPGLKSSGALLPYLSSKVES